MKKWVIISSLAIWSAYSLSPFSFAATNFAQKRPLLAANARDVADMEDVERESEIEKQAFDYCSAQDQELVFFRVEEIEDKEMKLEGLRDGKVVSIRAKPFKEVSYYLREKSGRKSKRIPESLAKKYLKSEKKKYVQKKTTTVPFFIFTELLCEESPVKKGMNPLQNASGTCNPAHNANVANFDALRDLFQQIFNKTPAPDCIKPALDQAITDKIHTEVIQLLDKNYQDFETSWNLATDPATKENLEFHMLRNKVIVKMIENKKGKDLQAAETLVSDHVKGMVRTSLEDPVRYVAKMKGVAPAVINYLQHLDNQVVLEHARADIEKNAVVDPKVSDLTVVNYAKEIIKNPQLQHPYLLRGIGDGVIFRTGLTPLEENAFQALQSMPDNPDKVMRLQAIVTNSRFIINDAPRMRALALLIDLVGIEEACHTFLSTNLGEAKRESDVSAAIETLKVKPELYRKLSDFLAYAKIHGLR